MEKGYLANTFSLSDCFASLFDVLRSSFAILLPERAKVFVGFFLRPLFGQVVAAVPALIQSLCVIFLSVLR